MNPNSTSSILIIGGGKAGSSLAYYFLENKIRIVAIVEKDPQRIQFLEDHLHWDFIENQIALYQLDKAGVILLAVQDDKIGSIVNNLAKFPEIWTNKTVLHLAGALPSSLLDPLRTKGACTGSLHPLFSFAADPRDNLNIDNCRFTLQSDQIVSEDLEQSLAINKDRIIPVTSEQKQAVHLASVFYTNFFIALADMGHEILTKSNIWPAIKPSFIQPLILSTIENLIKLGPAEALTGPLSRGDLETLRHHLRFLEKNHPDLKEAYQLLGKRLTMLSKMSKNEKQDIIDLLNLT